jgi:1-acyl-sn-glycerol-3-phosphate acyltransferase
MKPRRLLRPHPLVVPLMRAIVLRFLRRRYRLEAVGAEHVRDLKPPFIVVANHVNFWDPFWINAFISTPIQFVASDNLFRTTLLGFAMRLLGSIPKTKLMNDAQTIGHIFRVLEAGGVVGIFPEGTRSYDGRPSQFSTRLRGSSAS